MNYIVLDLEWNQSPSGRSFKNAPTFEIVEIGAVKLNEKCEELERFHSYIKPKIYKRMNYMTREVTGIDNKLLNREGRDFLEVIHSFFAFCGEDYKFCTWGDMDLTELQNNCDYYRLKGKFPYPLFFYDLQKLFSLQYEDGKDRMNLRSAVDMLEIEVDKGSHFHSAFTDAIYTAKVMERLDMATYGKYLSVDYHVLPKDKDSEIYLNFGNYTKYISREFKTKELAMEDPIVQSTTCYMCGRALRKKIRWFTINSKQFYCLCQCPEHGFLKGKVRMKKGHTGGVFVVKTQKLVDEAGALEIRNKQKQLRSKRQAKKKDE